jgi:hypothetical protein
VEMTRLLISPTSPRTPRPAGRVGARRAPGGGPVLLKEEAGQALGQPQGLGQGMADAPSLQDDHVTITLALSDGSDEDGEGWGHGRGRRGAPAAGKGACACAGDDSPL